MAGKSVITMTHYLAAGHGLRRQLPYKLLPPPNRKAPMKILPKILWLLAPSITILCIFIIAVVAGLRLNITDSVEQGIWQRIRFNEQEKHSLKGSIVTLCPDAANPYIALAKKRGYVSSGSCPNGLMPFLKPVAATAGDHITLAKDQVTVNGIAIPHTAIQERDSKGRPLPHYLYGDYKVGEDELWLIAPSNSHSFDSRYFGPVKRKDIQHIMKPVLTWSSTSSPLQCAPDIGKNTLGAIIHTESGGQPWVIGNNTMKRSYHYDNYDRTVIAAKAFIAAGHNIDIGLMQINSTNLKRLNLTPEQVVEPCTNIQAGSSILKQFYSKALRHTSDPQLALRYALSAYNTGSLFAGNKYVQQVLARAGI
jgi:type IV secretion system protein VirB1